MTPDEAISAAQSEPDSLSRRVCKTTRYGHRTGRIVGYPHVTTDRPPWLEPFNRAEYRPYFTVKVEWRACTVPVRMTVFEPVRCLTLTFPPDGLDCPECAAIAAGTERPYFRIEEETTV